MVFNAKMVRFSITKFRSIIITKTYGRYGSDLYTTENLIIYLSQSSTVLMFKCVFIEFRTVENE